MASDGDVFEVKCPPPSCEGTLRIRPTLPGGEHACICRACTVRVGWADYLQGGRRPYVTLVQPQQGDATR